MGNYNEWFSQCGILKAWESYRTWEESSLYRNWNSSWSLRLSLRRTCMTISPDIWYPSDYLKILSHYALIKVWIRHWKLRFVAYGPLCLVWRNLWQFTCIFSWHSKPEILTLQHRIDSFHGRRWLWIFYWSCLFIGDPLGLSGCQLLPNIFGLKWVSGSSCLECCCCGWSLVWRGTYYIYGCGICMYAWHLAHVAHTQSQSSPPQYIEICENPANWATESTENHQSLWFLHACVPPLPPPTCCA